MKRFLFLSVLYLLFIPGILFAQRDTLRNIFYDAESWFLFEEYPDAYVLYKKLLDTDPDNDNLKYKIGICLLNDPYRKEQAIPYLQDASDNINPEYKLNSFKERTAPPDVLYYLGEAYLVNEKLDKAIDTFQEFKKIMDQELYDAELVEAQIKACENAKRLMSMPVDIDLRLLGPTVNTRYADIDPVISGDGTRLAFVTEQPFFDEALFCEKADGEWSYPMSITSMLGFDADIYPVGLSYDGTEMVLYYDDDYIGNLYYSRLEDGFWIPAVKMGENISTKYWESYASFSRDGQTLYFTSNRKGTYGNLDIYRSERQPDGSWGVPVNLGPTINSRYNEESPVISQDGKTLYFSSYGHFNMGGYDVFYSKKNEDGSWAEPVNMGYPINTTDDDLYFQPVNNGKEAYYSRYSKQGAGEHDIYYMDIYSVDNPRMYMITGNLHTGEGTPDPGQVSIFVVDSKSGDTLLYSSPDRETGAFSFSLKQGIYTLHFTGPGYEELIRPLSITPASDKKGIVLEEEIALSLLQTEPRIFTGEESMIQLKDSLYEGVVGETVKIPLRLEPGSILITRIYEDSVLISEDTLQVEKRRTDIEITTGDGTRDVELVVIDSNNDLHMSHFKVVGKLPEKARPGRQIRRVLAQLPAGVDVQQLHQSLLENSEGPLNRYLQDLDPEKEGITTPEELMGRLEAVAEPEGYTVDQLREALNQSVTQLKSRETITESPDQAGGEGEIEGAIGDQMEIMKNGLAKVGDLSATEIDRLLAEKVSGGDVKKLYQSLLENSEGPLNRYLQELDLEKEGITTPAELLSHLEKVAEQEGFTMEQVREAMLKSLDNPLEVERKYKELLNTAEGPVREILERIDLQASEIYTVEDLIGLLYRELEEMGYSRNEIEDMLSGLFPSHQGFITLLTGQGKGRVVKVTLIGLAGAGILILIILWWRRRKDNQKPGE